MRGGTGVKLEGGLVRMEDFRRWMCRCLQWNGREEMGGEWAGLTTRCEIDAVASALCALVMVVRCRAMCV